MVVAMVAAWSGGDGGGDGGGGAGADYEFTVSTERATFDTHDAWGRLTTKARGFEFHVAATMN